MSAFGAETLNPNLSTQVLDGCKFISTSAGNWKPLK
jgi:hypothetical protein